MTVGSQVGTGGTANLATRPRSWRRSLFRPAAEAPFRRRARDVLVLCLAAGVVLAAAQHAGDVNESERALFRLFNTLPSAWAPVFRVIYRFGTLWVVGLVISAALLARRWRPAALLGVAGLLAWVSARALGELVVGHESITRSVRLATSFFGDSPSFPAVRLAVTTAVIVGAAPYVSRPTRMFGRVVILAVATAALYLGTGFPNDVVAGIALGWAVAAAVRLMFGSPAGRLTVSQVEESIAELGIEAGELSLAEEQPDGSTVMLGRDSSGPLRVKVIGRAEADRRLIERLWRSLIYKDPAPHATSNRVQLLEHEAYVMLMAREAGAKVPPVLAAGEAGHGAAVLVQRAVDGTPLSELAADDVSDELLAALWDSVAALQRARIVHSELDAEHVIVEDGTPWLVGFDAAATTRDIDRGAADVADLLVATAAIVGEERAVRAATDVLGRPKLVAALPYLQPAALTRATRKLSSDGRRDLANNLQRLRETAAHEAGVEPPELTRLRRVNKGSLAMALGTLIAIGALLSNIGDPVPLWNTLKAADPTWLAFAVALALISNVAYAIGLQGTVSVRLPLWPTTEVQLAMSFTNLAIPGIGGQAMQVRYLQEMGVDLSAAVTAGGVLSSLGGLAAALGLFALALIIEPARVNFSLLPTNGLVELSVIVVALVALASAITVAIPKLRRAIGPPIRQGAATAWTAVRSPRQLVLLLGGNVLATLISTWCLIACLTAFGGHISFWAILAANIGVVTVAQLVPIPGGGTAVGTVGLSALLVTFGIPKDIAVPTVLANQLIFYYLPAIPGWLATRHLIRQDYL